MSDPIERESLSVNGVMIDDENGSQQSDKQPRPAFGNRQLSDPTSVFQHNAWDNATWSEEQLLSAQTIAKKHAEAPLSQELQDKYDREAHDMWNSFYEKHQNRFFKDRHWLFTEFEELRCKDVDAKKITAPLKMLEIGCGVGNTVFPTIKYNLDGRPIFVYASDFSATAVRLVKENPEYHESKCHAFVWDITQETTEVEPCSLDVITCIFVLSALRPDTMADAVKRLAALLKPGGMILFRDYGRYDLAQLRFKGGRCLGENFYVRGDGTRVYFFTQEELHDLFVKGAGLLEVQNLVDRRLIVNRSRQLQMFRVWNQCKFMKPL